MFRTFLFTILATLMSANLFAAEDIPQSFTLDGRLFDSTTPTDPLLDSGTLVIQILNPAQTCILYEETQAFDTQTSDGYFHIRVGSATGDVKRGSADRNNAMTTVFSNTSSTNINGKLATDGVTNCSYNASSGDLRRLRIKVLGQDLTLRTLSPDMYMDSAPNTMVAERAETLQGLSRSQVLELGAGSLTQANVETVFSVSNYSTLTDLLSGTSTDYVRIDSNGAALPSLAADPATPAVGQIWYDTVLNRIRYKDNTLTIKSLGTGSGSVTSVTAGTGLTGGTITATGTIALDTVGTAGTYTKVTTDAYGRVSSGTTLAESDIPTLSTAGKVSGDAINTGTIGGNTVISTTGAIGTSSSVSARVFDVYDSDNSNFVRLQTPATGVLTSDYTLTLPSGTGVSGQFLTTDGSGTLSWSVPPNCTAAEKLQVSAGPMYTWSCISDVDSGGDITGVTTNAGSGLSGGAATGTPVLQVEVDGTTIEINGSNDLQVKDLGISTGKIAASAVTNAKINDVAVGKITSAAGTDYFTYTPAGVECTDGHTLKWTASNRWECAADNDAGGDITRVIASTGLSGGGTSGDVTLSIDFGTGSGQIQQNSSIPNCSTGDKLQMSAGPVYTWSCVSENSVASLTDADNDTKIQVEESADEDIIRFDTAGTQRMMINASGDVGIGTSNPSGKLHVVGSGISKFERSDASSNSVVNSFYVQRSNSGGAGADGIGTGVLFQVETETEGTMEPTAYIASSAADATAGTVDGILRFHTYLNGSASEAMRINEYGNIGIGTTSPDASSILDVSSTTKGFLPPRMTTGQRASIVTPAEGLIVYDTDVEDLYIYKNSTWTKLSNITEVAFSVDRNGSNQTIAATTTDTLNFTRENFDTASVFDLTTDRFTPTVAGYYYFTALGRIASLGSENEFSLMIYKNGSAVAAARSLASTTDNDFSVTASQVVYMNGTTDYVDLRVYNGAGSSKDIDGTDSRTYFQGFLISGGTGGGAGGGSDDLGNHVATQDLILGANWLSGDGDPEGLRVSGAGYVGIGTLTPQALLHVNGEVRATQICDEDGNNCHDISTGWSGSGDITAVNTNAGSGLTGGVATGSATLAINVDDSTVEVNGSNQLQIKDSGVTNAKISSVAISKITSAGSQYFGYMPNGLECASNGTLKWNATSDRWECGTDSDGGGDITRVIAGTGITGGGTSGDVTVSIDYGTDAIQVQQNSDIPHCTSLQKLEMTSGPVYTWSCVDASVARSVADADGDTKIQVEESSDEDYIRFDTAGSERLVIDNAGNIGIGTTSPSASANLEINSTTKGFLPSRMTTVQRDAISSPAIGLMIYNTTTDTVDIYRSTGWKRLAILPDCNDGELAVYSSGEWVCTSNPDAFTFTDLTGRAVSTVVSSEIKLLTGAVQSRISVAGASSPLYRICLDVSCATVLRDWTSTAGTIAQGQYFQLRQTTQATTNGAPSSLTVQVGSVSDVWTAATQDNTPDSLSFTDLTAQEENTLITSDSITINGIGPAAVSVSVSGASGTPRLSVNGGAWVSSSTITNGQTLRVRMTTDTAYDTMRSLTVTLGNSTDQWDLTTKGLVEFQAHMATLEPTTCNTDSGCFTVGYSATFSFRVTSIPSAGSVMWGSPWAGRYFTYDSSLYYVLLHGFSSFTALNDQILNGGTLVVTCVTPASDRPSFSAYTRNGYTSNAWTTFFGVRCTEILYWDYTLNAPRTMNPWGGTGPTTYTW